MKLSKLLPVFLFWFSFDFCFAADNQTLLPSTLKLFERLDSVLEVYDQLEQQKENRILSLKQQLQHTQDGEEQFFLNNQLYNEYYVYETDSAMKFVQQNLRLSEKENNSAHYAQSIIHEAFILSNTGSMDEALHLMNELDHSNFTRDLNVQYYDQMQFIYFNLVLYYSGDASRQRKYQQYHTLYTDSLVSLLQPSDPSYLKNKAMQAVAHGTYNSQLANQIILSLEKSQLTTRDDASLAFNLANLYQLQNNRDRYVWALIQSAIADVLSCNRDVVSMKLLAEILLDEGDLARAYTYINFCQRVSQLAHNPVRILSLNESQNKIQQSVLENMKQNQRRNTLYNWIFVVVILLLVIMLFCLIRYFNKVRRSRRLLKCSYARLEERDREISVANDKLMNANTQLQVANGSLSELNQQMEQINMQLSQENELKEEYIAYVFAICSNYISKLDDYRKNINRKLKVGQFEDLKHMTDSQTMTQAEIKEFCQHFDQIFLKVYPDFAQDFNQLLRPEEQLNLPEQGHLNTDLRIYALIRLGITDSVKIADFLHCSTQTVYNARMKMRNKAICSKDEFDKTVRMLGNITKAE